MIKRIIIPICAIFYGSFAMAYENVSPQQAYEMVQANEAIIIDVREQEEYDESSITGAQLFPLSQLSMDDVKKIQDHAQGKKIILQCRSGKRSVTAANEYESMGLTSVYNMEHGIIGWAKDNLPLEK